MFFLKKLPFINLRAEEPTPIINTPSLEQDIPAEMIENVNNALEQNYSYETQSSTLFGKFHRSQNLYTGPEASFENEAWAPEYQPIKLFHRPWSTTEEQIASPSDSQ
ncbi:hypothetical protein [Desulfitobacterium sp.]|uniref:Uncharacterized protein n=1 Tax=bioreactor metagenome TaxID=1076179 RepID=A0A645IHH7_9ZZZZ|nr:hypothetical protein [Desulfitobacterium sp.]MEA4902421.1 hypothetical protein [Desulfitobacterium sp.]